MSRRSFFPRYYPPKQLAFLYWQLARPATRTTTSTAATLEPVQLVRTEALLQPVNWHHKGPVLWSVQNHPNHISNLINSSVKTCFLILSRPDWCTAETYKCDKHHIYHAFTWKTEFKRKGTFHLRFSGIRPLRGYPPPLLTENQSEKKKVFFLSGKGGYPPPLTDEFR